MAVVYVRGAGMTSSDSEAESSTVSALKEETQYAFPDGEVFTAVPGALDQAEKDALARRIKQWEKDSLIARKSRGEITGAIRDTRSRYGDPKEWDHIQFMLEREESESYNRADLERARDIIRDLAAKDISGRFQKMVITRIHTDTGNTHIDVIVHRHPFDAEGNMTLPTDELTASSRLSAITEKINSALSGAGLPIIKDVKKQDGQSLYEESATSERAKHVVNALVEQEGGIPNQRTGAPAVYADDDARPARMRIQDPDAKMLEKMVLDAERDAKAAAQRLVSAQNALAAQNERAELRARLEEANAAAAEQEAAIEAARLQHTAELTQRESAIAALNTDIEKANERETALRAELETVSTKVEEQTAQITGLTNDYENAQLEIAEQDTTIQALQGELFTLNGQVTAQADQLTERAQMIAQQAADIEALRGEVDQAKAVISEKSDVIAVRDATIAQLTTEVTTTAAALATAKETLSKQSGEIERLRATVHQRDMDVAKATGAIEALDKQVGTLTNERDAFRATAEKQTEALQIAIIKNDDLTVKNDELKEKSGEILRSFKETRDLHNRILNVIAEYVPEETRTDLPAAVKSFVTQYVNLSSNDVTAQKKVKDLEAMVSKVQTENEQMRTILAQIREGGTDEGEGRTGGDPPPSI